MMKLYRYPVPPMNFLPISIAKSDGLIPSSSDLFSSSLLNFKTAASHNKGARASYLPSPHPQNSAPSERPSSKVPKSAQTRQDDTHQLEALFGLVF